MNQGNVVKADRRIQTVDLVYVAIGAALIAVCSWISIPTVVPFTLQTFAVFFILSLLGGKRGTFAVLLYILLGVVGLPVFAGFSGGIGALLRPSGGYIIGFLAMGLIYRAFIRTDAPKLWLEITALVVGLLACYAFGTAWFMYVYIRDSGAVGLITVLGWCVFPFIIPDLVKMGLALAVAKRVRPALR